MHFAFIPYGKRSEVELMLRDMEAQKHLLPMWKAKKNQSVWIQGQVRILPFGVYEYVFPRENLDKVLTTLFQPNRYISEFKKSVLRKSLKLEKVPEFKNDKKYLWIKDNVNIIPIGIRKDLDIIGKHELDKGWTHEAI